jgi:hypothetical protein
MKSTSTLILRKAFFLSSIFFLTLFFSCKKDGKLTPDFDNGNLQISYVDTFEIITSVEREDSLRTDALSLNLVGLYNDPIFGQVSSALYTQVLLTGVNLDFETATPTVDSIVLTLAYAGLYGDTASSMTLNVYELDADLDVNTDYYSNTPTAYKSTLEGSLNFVPNLRDSVDIEFDTIKRAPHVRIKLNNSFGDKILTAPASDLTDDAAFANFIKGLYITTSENVDNSSLSSGSGSIAYFDMNSELSTLTMYYDDSLSYSFSINTSTEKYSQFSHNYTATDVEKQLNNEASKITDRTYVSSMAGVKTKIELPTIRDLVKEDPVIINKATLIFTVETGSDLPNDAIDETLYLVGIDADGNQIILADNNSSIETDNTHFGGVYESETSSYSFNITRHLHQLLTTTETDYGMYLVSSGAKTEANRVVLGSGEENTTYKIRLEITYSKI